MLEAYLPETAAGLPISDAVWYGFLAVAIGTCANVVILYLVHGTFLNEPTRNAARTADAGPLYSYLLCMVTQAVVFPTLFILSARQFPDLYSHCTASWADCDVIASNDATGSGHALNGLCWMRIFAFALLSYLCKDLLFCNFMETCHHAAGIFITIGFMLQRSGIFTYMSGCFVMECANVFLNLSHVWAHAPTRIYVHAISLVTMFVSNILGLYFAYLTFVNRDPQDSTVFFSVFAICAVCVVYFRSSHRWSTFWDVYYSTATADDASRRKKV